MKNLKVAIIGGGIFGLYIAKTMLEFDLEVDVYEQEDSLGKGASQVNQARLHLGYHYPRSEETAKQCISGFEKFAKEFEEGINKDFKQYYTIAKNNSKTNKIEYLDFCKKMNLPHKIVELESNLINSDQNDLVIETLEYSFDWKIVIDKLEYQVRLNGGKILLNHKIVGGDIKGLKKSLVSSYKDLLIKKDYDIVINSAYANINGLNKVLGAPLLPLSFELCEMIKVKVPDKLKNVGITIMDGDYTSIMPYGLSGYHTISNVRNTPHERSDEDFPSFSCNKGLNELNLCSDKNLNVCLNCSFRPITSFDKMIDFGQKYIPILKECVFVESMITVKAILNNVENTDARPSSIFEFESIPNYFCIFSGKVDTVIDIAENLMKKLRLE
jgi:hypothetical protein